ncbi:hypothetical protein QPK87_31120 [Kamptonema cortianum]|nr:hypothetical protein [Geitlerinema splendidum]MDK3160977.1 hypothetical protein [Kamptonema cortianum]
MSLRSGGSLVGTIVTIAILALLAIAFVVGPDAFGGKKSSRPDGKGTTVVGRAGWAAKDEACRSNIDQVRSGITIYSSSDPDGTPPPTIEDTRIGSDFYRCPVGKEPYLYDPSTGQVKCPHPGHEKY